MKLFIFLGTSAVLSIIVLLVFTNKPAIPVDETRAVETYSTEKSYDAMRSPSRKVARPRKVPGAPSSESDTEVEPVLVKRIGTKDEMSLREKSRAEGDSDRTVSGTERKNGTVAPASSSSFVDLSDRKKSKQQGKKARPRQVAKDGLPDVGDSDRTVSGTERKNGTVVPASTPSSVDLSDRKNSNRSQPFSVLSFPGSGFFPCFSFL